MSLQLARRVSSMPHGSFGGVFVVIVLQWNMMCHYSGILTEATRPGPSAARKTFGSYLALGRGPYPVSLRTSGSILDWGYRAWSVAREYHWQEGLANENGHQPLWTPFRALETTRPGPSAARTTWVICRERTGFG